MKSHLVNVSSTNLSDTFVTESTSTLLETFSVNDSEMWYSSPNSTGVRSRHADVLAYSNLLVQIIGIYLNMITIVMFLRRCGEKIVRNFLILSLSISDVIMAAIVVSIQSASLLLRRWLGGDVGCRWYGFLFLFSGVTGIYTFTTISIER